MSGMDPKILKSSQSVLGSEKLGGGESSGLAGTPQTCSPSATAN